MLVRASRVATEEGSFRTFHGGSAGTPGGGTVTARDVEGGHTQVHAPEHTGGIIMGEDEATGGAMERGAWPGPATPPDGTDAESADVELAPVTAGQLAVKLLPAAGIPIHVSGLSYTVFPNPVLRHLPGCISRRLPGCVGGGPALAPSPSATCLNGSLTVKESATGHGGSVTGRGGAVTGDEGSATGKGRAETEWRRGKALLREVTFDALPGEVLAVAGASGAGKSTLLDAVAGRIRPSSLQGELRVHGLPVGSPLLRRITGYVTQEDALFPVLTPRETLLLSARLRLPGHVSAQERARRVDELLDQLGLQHVADSRIGDVDSRGISGGEKRRVSIGTDLVHDPPVLLLDEPTSGLDSHAALNVLEVLQRMARQGRTIMLTIHQPGVRILEQVDKLLLLSRGRVVHHGTTRQLEGRLDSLGLPVPLRMNALEYAIELLKTHPKAMEDLPGLPSLSSSPSEEDFSPFEPPALVTTHSFSTTSAASTPYPSPSFHPTQCGDHVVTSFAQPVTQPGIQAVAQPVIQAGAGDVAAPRCSLGQVLGEFGALAGRNMKVMLRTRELSLGRAAQVLFCSLCLGTLFLHVPNTAQGAEERMGFLAFSLAFLLTSSMEALPIFLKERQVFLRETTSGAYHVISYLLASVLVFLPFLLALAVLYSAGSYWLVGLYPRAAQFLFFVLTIWVVLLTANAIVAFLAALAPDFITANSLVAGLLGAMFLFSGFFIAKRNIPAYWAWMYHLSVFKYPLEALLVNEYAALGTTAFTTGGTGNQNGQQVLESLGLNHTSKWAQLATLAGFAVVYRALCFVALSWQRTMRH